LRVIQRAIRDAARIGGDDGVITCQRLSQRREVCTSFHHTWGNSFTSP
jgi:hypothetical protein